MNALELATLFHDTYEQLAPVFGYETKEETKVFNQGSSNGKLMIATCEYILPMIGDAVCYKCQTVISEMEVLCEDCLCSDCVTENALEECEYELASIRELKFKKEEEI